MSPTAGISAVGRGAIETAPEGHCVDGVGADGDWNVEVSDYAWPVSEGVTRTNVGIDMESSVVR